MIRTEKAYKVAVLKEALHKVDLGANRIGGSGHSCCAIWTAELAYAYSVDGEIERDNLALEYGELFAPDSGFFKWCGVESLHMLWLRDTGMSERELKQWRLTALAFALAMVEAGDL